MNMNDGLQAASLGSGIMTRCEFATFADPWPHILLRLDQARMTQQAAGEPDAMGFAAVKPAAGESRKGQARCKSKRSGAAKCEPVCPTTVTLLDRISPRSVILRWCSTSCHYGYQVWVCGKARRSGVCPLTGKSIRRGDLVYRPKMRSGGSPANAGAMIHPSALP